MIEKGPSQALGQMIGHGPKACVRIDDGTSAKTKTRHSEEQNRRLGH